METLHRSPYQQEMIAEINEPFSPALIVMDGVDVFVDGGPATGKRAAGNLTLATTDRIAADAAGVAVLRALGGNRALQERPIFAQRQIARAVELGLGATSARDITLKAADEQSSGWCQRLRHELQDNGH
jgi:uncharacterized protein (DUF362 family)